ncbi:dihydropteroate synthase [Methanohalobium evestigatum Z-7303]|uniref:dihydropteroate synthase n=1 Tax=Methanohalobium evestigatum (strain ATCC BAA-1072 / DSM 3721 / NBRC 107634 / OCM 161 / Z-7303) TaxID=644295 RepID=D7E5X8_METEZ|nr:dihydropteroate synthase [Methanohalobium evestigatum Z-7303]
MDGTGKIMAVDSDICGLKVGDEHPVRLMGVINLSQESFYKNSVIDKDSIINTAQDMVDKGATMIDVGGRSTWPLAEKITKKQETERLLPALEELKGNVDAVISVDTMFADIAEESLKRGVDVVNDVSGLTADSRMVDLIADYDCPAVVMASYQTPGDPFGMDAVMDSLSSIIKKAESKDIDPNKLILDPAFGKWVPEKDPIYDFETADQFERLKIFEKPLLAAVSRKSMIKAVTGKPAEERLYGSLAATSLVVHKGADIIRTHDIHQTKDVVDVAKAIRSRSPYVRKNGFEVSVLDVNHPSDAAYLIQSIGATTSGSNVMKKKSVYRVLRINNITTTEALIIKQEMLARGADAAISRDAVSHEDESTDVILMGTLLQIEQLVDKLSCQARNLPLIADMIEETLEQYTDTKYLYQ